MKILVVLGHPDQKSFNHALAQSIRQKLKSNNHEVIFHDLYKEKFPPLLESEELPKHSSIDKLTSQHCAELSSADGIIVIHPNWWGQPPAIIKGWIDRVFREGIAYELLEDDSDEEVPVGLLKAKTALVFNTSNQDANRERSVSGDSLEIIWKNYIFEQCGVEEFHLITFGNLASSSTKQRTQWMNEAEKITNKYFPIL